MKKVSLFIAIIAITTSYSLTAQVSITSNGGAPDGSAMLDVKSAEKGMLMPRVALTGTTDETTISSPVVSLMIYNTAIAQGVIPGFYYWNGAAWAPVSKTADGSETKVTGGTNITVTGVGTTASPYVVNASYSVGDFVQGGIVFWVDKTGQHGLVCAKEDQRTSNNLGAPDVVRDVVRWWGGNASQWWVRGATQAKGNGVYAGETNTAIIMAAHLCDICKPDGFTFAARVCYELQITEGGKMYSDWYLPSKDELNLIFQNRIIIDAIAYKNGGSYFYYGSGEHDYWSSTERSSYHAWYQSFETGHQSDQNDKDHCSRIRAIRAF